MTCRKAKLKREADLNTMIKVSSKNSCSSRRYLSHQHQLSSLKFMRFRQSEKSEESRRNESFSASLLPLLYLLEKNNQAKAKWKSQQKAQFSRELFEMLVKKGVKGRQNESSLDLPLFIHQTPRNEAQQRLNASRTSQQVWLRKYLLNSHTNIYREL